MTREMCLFKNLTENKAGRLVPNLVPKAASSLVSIYFDSCQLVIQ